MPCSQYIWLHTWQTDTSNHNLTMPQYCCILMRQILTQYKWSFQMTLVFPTCEVHCHTCPLYHIFTSIGQEFTNWSNQGTVFFPKRENWPAPWIKLHITHYITCCGKNLWYTPPFKQLWYIYWRQETYELIAIITQFNYLLLCIISTTLKDFR